MKKIISAIIAAAFGTMLFAVPAFAATTASLTPASVTVVAGQQFNVVILVNPNGTANYAEQLQVSYPTALLHVTSFNFGSGWMALSQPGYDSVDNTNGILIKSAGYPGGITSATPFGTITFTAQKSGSGTISIGSGSQAFEKSGHDPITGTGVSVVVTAASATPKNTATPAVSNTTAPSADQSAANDLTPVSTVNGQVVASSAAIIADAQTAAAVNAASSSHALIIWATIIAVIIIVIALFISVSRKNRK